VAGAFFIYMEDEMNTEYKGDVGDANVEYVRAVQDTDRSWTFSVTVSHPDKGWDDYADGWDVVALDGTVFKPDSAAKYTRVLLHPHVGEQPFTRSQSGIVIPPGVTKVRVRAHDSVDGYGGQEIMVDLETGRGNGYELKKRT
jgi:hypothetical protein